MQRMRQRRLDQPVFALSILVATLGVDSLAFAGSSGTSIQAPAPAALYSDATDAEIVSVALNQGTEVFVFDQGKALSPQRAPLVVGRGGVVNAIIRERKGTSAGPRDVTVEAEFEAKGRRVLRENSISISSSSDSKVHIPFDASDVPIGAMLRLRVRETAPAVGSVTLRAGAHRFPADVRALVLDLRETGTLKVRIVPIQVESGTQRPSIDFRLFATERMRQRLLSMFPVQRVEITTIEPMVWKRPMRNLADADQLNLALAVRRVHDKAPGDNLLPWCSVFSCQRSCTNFIQVTTRRARVRSWLGQRFRETARVAHSVRRSGSSSIWHVVR